MSQPEQRTTDRPNKSAGSSFSILWAIPAVIVAAWLFMQVFAPPARNLGDDALGGPLPPLTAQGWINGEAPSTEELAGKVVVIDAWGSYCGPCARQAPELVALHKKYRDRGVVFLGFSPEPSSRLKEMEAFVEYFGITWPNGYGAGELFEKLEITGVPSTFVFGRDGKLVWHYDSPGSLEDGIQIALSKK